VFTLQGADGDLTPHQEITLVIEHQGKTREVPLTLRFDTPIEVEYYKHGGIMPYVLRQIIKR
jgi:aconitate hydratase